MANVSIVEALRAIKLTHAPTGIENRPLIKDLR